MKIIPRRWVILNKSSPIFLCLEVFKNSWASNFFIKFKMKLSEIFKTILILYLVIQESLSVIIKFCWLLCYVWNILLKPMSKFVFIHTFSFFGPFAPLQNSAYLALLDPIKWLALVPNFICHFSSLLFW